MVSDIFETQHCYCFSVPLGLKVSIEAIDQLPNCSPTRQAGALVPVHTIAQVREVEGGKGYLAP